MQLQGSLDEFRNAGLGVVVLTYDSPAKQQAFIDRHRIGYPMLSDIDATSVRALGILNTEYAPGDDNYGLPWPGIFVLDGTGKVAGKIFIEGYDTRVDATHVLEYALRVTVRD